MATLTSYFYLVLSELHEVGEQSREVNPTSGSVDVSRSIFSTRDRRWSWILGRQWKNGRRSEREGEGTERD